MRPNRRSTSFSPRTLHISKTRIYNTAMRCTGDPCSADSFTRCVVPGVRGEPPRITSALRAPPLGQVTGMVDRGSDARYPGLALIEASAPAPAPVGFWRRTLTSENALMALRCTGQVMLGVAQILALFTPRINVGIGINPTWPAHWPVFFARRAPV